MLYNWHIYKLNTKLLPDDNRMQNNKIICHVVATYISISSCSTVYVIFYSSNKHTISNRTNSHSFECLLDIIYYSSTTIIDS